MSKPSRKVLQNDEIESSEDDEEFTTENSKRISDEEEEDDVETVQEKRFRLAKQYLSDIEKQGSNTSI